MKRFVLILTVIVLVGCTTRVRYEYFEPSGMGATIRSPHEAPPNVAHRKIGKAELSVWATVLPSGIIEVSLRAEVPAGQSLNFRGRTATLITPGVEQFIPLRWTQWRIVNGRGAPELLEFDAPLMGATFTDRPQRQSVQVLGRYDCAIALPESLSAAKDFTLILPAPMGEDERVQLAFKRKSADYRTGYQLQ